MHLGGMGLPGAGAGLAAAHLDHPGQGVVEGGAPVEAVAAEIHQPPAPGEIGIEGIEHGRRVIFGMAAGDDRAIGREQRQALAVDILVGDDVAALADGVQPVGDVEIGVEVPDPLLGAGVEDRAQPRGIAGAAAVAMAVIGGDAEVAALQQEQIRRREFQQGAVADLGDGILIAMMAVGIGHEGGGRGDEGQRRGRQAPRRLDEEGNEILASLAARRRRDGRHRRRSPGPRESSRRNRSASGSRRDRRYGNGWRRRDRAAHANGGPGRSRPHRSCRGSAG